MNTYTIEPVREALHSSFPGEYPVILTIDSSNTLRFRTLNASWILDLSEDPPKRFEPHLNERDDDVASWRNQVSEDNTD